MKNPCIELAYQAIKHFLKTKKVLGTPLDFPKEMLGKQAGTFVSLHQKDNSLRGCIGTYLPTKKNIAEEIIANAISAATKDPRFPPVTQKELPNLKISVDILNKPKLVKEDFKLGQSLPKILNPKKCGLLVSTKDGRKGLLLPDIAGVDSAYKQIEICLKKAGISPQEAINLEVFTVKRHHYKQSRPQLASK